MAIDIKAFRTDFIREVKDLAEENESLPTVTFINKMQLRFGDQLGMPPNLDHCYIDRQRQGKFKQMRLDAGSYDPATMEANLFLADFNEDAVKILGREDILDKVKALVNFYVNACNGFYPPQASGPEADLANLLKRNRNALNRLRLFILTTDKLSDRIKEINLPAVTVEGNDLKIKLEVIDIERIYNNLEGPEEFTIETSAFGCPQIPCVKADIATDAYETYLAIVPGSFLSEIYKEYGGKLLKANVRSFLNMTGSVNKGIRDTIKNEPQRFFAYNNGIATTAKTIEFANTDSGLAMKSFTGLQIINGGQTTASLALASVKDHVDLSNIFVQMKLTKVDGDDKVFIRNIAKFANSQTKVTTTDLNSSHEYYVMFETLSRSTYAPVAPGAIKPTKWFFERTKKQYEQPMFQMTKAEKKQYEALYPKKQKINVQELARYIQLYELRPYDVAWGGELNARRFHERIEKQWDMDNSFCDEGYFKRIVAMVILYARIKKLVSDAAWYQSKKGNLAQIVAYTFSKLVHDVKTAGFDIDLMAVWSAQEMPTCFDHDILGVSKLVFDVFYDPYSAHTDVREYCKSKECWEKISAITYELSDDTLNGLKMPLNGRR